MTNHVIDHEGPHDCKDHGYAHAYLQCTCGCEFCGYYWLGCPREDRSQHRQEG